MASRRLRLAWVCGLLASLVVVLGGQRESAALPPCPLQPCNTGTVDPINGCNYTPLPAGRPCSAAQSCRATSGACDGAGRCVAPALAAGTACDDRNGCTAGDACDGNGGCAGKVTAGAACDDGNACTYGETCSSGAACVGGTSVTCASTSCTRRSCNGTASCTVVQTTAGTTCDDGNACTYADACDGNGTCGGTAVTCSSNTCATSTCNGTATCSIVPQNGRACVVARSDHGTCSNGTCGLMSLTPADVNRSKSTPTVQAMAWFGQSPKVAQTLHPQVLPCGNYVGTYGVPAAVTVPAGQAWVSFAISPGSYTGGTFAFPDDQCAKITFAEYPDVVGTFTMHSRSVRSVGTTLPPNNRVTSAPSFAAGSPIPVVITLDQAAPAAGFNVTLTAYADAMSSSSSQNCTVSQYAAVTISPPPAVTVPGGSTQVTVQVPTSGKAVAQCFYAITAATGQEIAVPQLVILAQ